MSRASVWILAMALVCSLASPPPRPAPAPAAAAAAARTPPSPSLDSEPPHLNAIPSSETDLHAAKPPVDIEVESDDPGTESEALTDLTDGVDLQPETDDLMEAETPSGVALPSESETEPPSEIEPELFPVTKPSLTDIGSATATNKTTLLPKWFSSTVCTLDGDNHTTQVSADSGSGGAPDEHAGPDETDNAITDGSLDDTDTAESFVSSTTETRAPAPPPTQPYEPPPSLEPAPFYVDDS